MNSVTKQKGTKPLAGAPGRLNATGQREAQPITTLNFEFSDIHSHSKISYNLKYTHEHSELNAKRLLTCSVSRNLPYSLNSALFSELPFGNMSKKQLITALYLQVYKMKN